MDGQHTGAQGLARPVDVLQLPDGSILISDDAGGRFAIDASTGVVTVADGSLLDYESATSHTVTVQATSSDGSTSSETFTVNLTDDTSEASVGAMIWMRRRRSSTGRELPTIGPAPPPREESRASAR